MLFFLSELLLEAAGDESLLGIFGRNGMFHLKSREAGVCYWLMAALGGPQYFYLIATWTDEVLRERVADAPSKKPLACRGKLSAEAGYIGAWGKLGAEAGYIETPCPTMGSARVGSMERFRQKDRQLPILQIYVDGLRVNLGCALESEIPVKELKGLETQDFSFLLSLVGPKE